MNQLSRALFIAIIMLSAQMIAQSGHTCHTCNKPIANVFLEVDGYYYHPIHFRCELCKKQITGLYQRIGENYYHPECYAQKKGLVCALCGKPLSGRYITAGDKMYHDTCYTGTVAARCAICGEVLEGTYVSDSYDNAYHERHIREFDKCFICGRLICGKLTGGGDKIGDGRSICNLCYRKVVIDYGQRDRLLEKVMFFLQSIGIKLNPENISVKTVGLSELQSVSGTISAPGNVRGFCQSESSGMTRNGAPIGNKTYRHTIYVLDYLPETELEGIFAHELTHAWIFENTPGKQTLSVQEGSCNFVAWLFLRSCGEPDAPAVIKRMDEDPDPVYGNGYRSIKAKFEKKPVSEFLASLKK